MTDPICIVYIHIEIYFFRSGGGWEFIGKIAPRTLNLYCLKVLRVVALSLYVGDAVNFSFMYSLTIVQEYC